MPDTIPHVLIVGAGPTGATLALLLLQRGIQVTVVEAAKDFQRVFRGEGLMPSGLEALDQMGLRSLLATVPHRPLNGWQFMLGDRRLFTAAEPMDCHYPCTLVSQPALLTAIIDKAKEFDAFTFLPGVAVKDLSWQGERCTGVVLGDGEAIKADLVIGADGRNSTVRDRAGLELNTQPKTFDVLWFKLPVHPRFIEENIFLSVLRGDRGFSVFHGAEDGKLQLAWVLFPDETGDWKHTNWSETLANVAPHWLADHFRQCGDAIESPRRLSVVVGHAPCWHKPGLLLLGDAAHPMSPVRAQGINMALRDVIVAANHLVPLLQSGADPGSMAQVLSQIQDEREPEIIQAQELQIQEASQGAGLRNSPLKQFIFQLFIPLFRDQARQAWMARQIPLRQGITEVNLQV
ncbi:FAD-dependent monooxygenase [Candidatus Synechococcus calcipolaris G9]|uniref:FAD-dependent monooxygenase n=1 Tax=Candidatus Synechococcus calcipolaris G9 TaxID=1497997 RepID=A0ABT6EX82_9SYNE|nr:FAD-dependent monooxygenase [Candidatus Synechococcus calcipolaris]MDG2990404.1 FAD-dependent monooxygenase [Candidatus Synechococcus calcipolaris G9]